MICAQEMMRLPGVQVSETGYRRVHARCTGDLAKLLSLRTVDDIFIQLAQWQGIGPHRSTLALLEQLSLDLDLWQAVNQREAIHPLHALPAFSVSANFVGRRNYTSDEIKHAVAKGVEAISGWRYEEDDRLSDTNLRIFIEHETALVGMRLGNSPLYKRSYKHEHVPGSLKPSVAAALLFLAQVSPGERVLDPFCGAGTLLIEAAYIGALAQGGDHDEVAVVAARRNAEMANVMIDVQVWDARSLPLENASADQIVTNLPWGRQVDVDSALAQFYQESCAEMERVLAPDGRAVLLTNLPHMVSFSHLHIEKQEEISLFGQLPTIVVASAMP